MLEISQKPGGGGGKGCQAEHPLYTPLYFLNYGYILW